jgi:putative transposase
MTQPRRRPYQTDLTDAEWKHIEPLLPQRRPGDGRGAPRQHDRREILNAIFYQLRTGCPWDYLPRDFPPTGTVYDYLRDWKRDGTLDRIHGTLREQVREAAGRDAQPSAGIVDSQSVKSTEKGGPKARLGTTEGSG